MSSKISVVDARAVRGAGTIVSLAETIDESFSPDCLSAPDASIVLFDMDAVRTVTSYGVLRWMKAAKAIRASEYGFARCRPSIVRQFNMVARFGQQGSLYSIYLPFFCEPCRLEYELILDLTRLYSLVEGRVRLLRSCPRCGERTELDEDSESYFGFASDYPEPRPSDLMLKLLNELATNGAEARR